MESGLKSTPIEALSANVVETRFENFDKETLENARYRIIDVLGCCLCGANAAGNSEMINLVKDWGGKREASIISHGVRVPAHNAAMANCVMARSFDFEPVGVVYDGEFIASHISGTTVMTAITLGEMMDIDGKELVCALLAGDDIASRMLIASGFHLNRGWCNTGTVNAVGATAIAGRLLGLDKRQIQNAFGIVLSQLAGSVQNVWDGCTIFKLPQGLSARNGIFSAQLAKAGWTGPDDMLLSRFGYYHLYTEGCTNPDILASDLGKKYYSDCHFKPYPSCRGTNPPLDCAVSLVTKHNIKADEISEVIHYVPPYEKELFCAKPFHIGDFPHGNAIFSYPFTLANALYRGCSRPEHFSEDSIRDPGVNALAGKIQIKAMPGGEMLTARVDVKMKDGTVFSEFTDTPKGDPYRNPMTAEEKKDKFRFNVRFSGMVNRDKAEKALDLLLNIEELDSVKRVVDLVTD